MKISVPNTSRIINIIGSKPFFWGIVLLLVVQATWIALTGRYPMAFDEDFHLGIIRLYAHHPNPFWQGPVDGGDAFGAVARDPSYLYHYLMSFPYRVIGFLTSNIHVQVVLLRLLNIGFFSIGLYVYRKLLLQSRASKAVVNTALLVFVLIPVTPLLAAQINYDNIFIPLTGIALLLTLRLTHRSTSKQLDAKTLLSLILVCLLTAVVKYAFLPIFLVILGYCAVVGYKKYKTARRLVVASKAGFKQISRYLAVGFILAFILVGGLFFERYGVNLIRYHKPVADCSEVLDYEHCKYYGPWIRDYNFKQQKSSVSSSPLAYSYEWFYGMWFRSFFAVDGATTNFITRGPLTLPSLSALALLGIGLVAFVLKAKIIWKKYDKSALWLILSVAIGYVSVLWLEEYRMYLETGKPVAINGRYLLPILPFIILLGILAFKELTLNRPKIQLSIATLAILCFAWGGGALTYILRSSDSWYWQNDNLVKNANHAVQHTLGPITPGYNKPTQFLR